MKRGLIGGVLTPLAGVLLMGATLPELSVQVQADKLTVRVESVPLYGVMWAISAQTGIKVNIPGGRQSAELAELLVTDDFKDLPLEQGVKRLLGKYLDSANYIIITDKKTGLPQSVHILAGTPSTSASPVGTSPSPVTNVPGSPPTLAERMAPEISIEQALDAAREAQNSEEQIKALQALGNFQDPRSLEVLGPALHSDQAEVRKAALEAMRWGTVEDAETLTGVRSVAASDPDPAVRQAGLEVLVRYDESAETRALLEKLASEEEGVVDRDFVLRELKRMDKEAKARSLPDLQVQQVQEGMN